VRAAGSTVVPGDAAFLLHDTHGFPIDLVTEMAREEGLTVDETEFRRLMAEQQQRAKRDSVERKSGGHADLSLYRGLLESSGATSFTGYDALESDATLAGLLADGAAVPAAGAGIDVEVVLDRSPFYAEGGGQLADHGTLQLADGTVIEIYDAQRPLGDLIVHRGRVLSGEARVGSSLHAQVDPERRNAISRAHTATHLVHQAIRRALGDHASQAGSQNDAGRFRFDFASPNAVPDSVLSDIEAEVNAVLLADLDVHAFVTSQDEAKRLGAIAMFGEKYGDQVRVVEVGDYSRELCGGTHAHRSSQLGVVKLLGEASIGAGKRRVEGLVGADAYSSLAREHLLVSQLSGLLNVGPEDLVERVGSVVGKVRELEKELEKVRGAAVLSGAADLAANAVPAGGALVVAQRVPDETGADDLRRLALDVRARLDAGVPGVVAAASVTDGRAVVVVATNEAARERGLRAGEFAKQIAGRLGGGGGGKDDVAQGGGTDVSQLDDVLAGLATEVAGRL
jgi:alanyl-tRNA synthetase